MSSTDGSPTKTGWKRRSSAASFSMCLRYSSSVVAPTARSSPRASIGLSMFAASTAPSAAPAPTIVCSSSMKRTISPSGARDLLEHRLQPLLELAAVLRAREQRADVERPDALALQALGHVAGDDPLREPLDDRRLADAGVADQHRVVLRAAREHLDHAADLLVAPDHRVELPLLRERGQVAAELLERLVRLLGVLRGHALAAAHLLDPLEQLVARDGVEREQQVLGRDVVVSHRRASSEARSRTFESARHRRLLVRALNRRAPAQHLPPLRCEAPERIRRAAAAAPGRAARAAGARIDLRVAQAARELLRGADRFLGLECQLVEVHCSCRRPAASSRRERARAGTACERSAPRRAAAAAASRSACAPSAARPRAGSRARRRRG